MICGRCFTAVGAIITACRTSHTVERELILLSSLLLESSLADFIGLAAFQKAPALPLPPAGLALLRTRSETQPTTPSKARAYYWRVMGQCVHNCVLNRAEKATTPLSLAAHERCER